MNSPFKFLNAYEKEDKDRFFGREKEIAQLYHKVFAANLTLLYGASGTGKTSLVNCGLNNKFYETDWLPLFIQRKEHIGDSLAEIVGKAIEKYSNKQAYSYAQLSIPEQVKLLYQYSYRPVFLIFDQFEELFIMGKSTEQWDFYNTIAVLLKTDIPAKIIIIMREEWMAYLNDFERRVPTLFDNRLRVEPMNDKNLSRVILGTARQANIHLNPPKTTIVDIINNLRDKQEGVALSNLQVYLDRLYRKYLEIHGTHYKDQVVFSPDLVKEVGAVKNVIADFLEEQLLIIENKLAAKKVANPKGLPLEILFALVTDEGTKTAKSTTDIMKSIPQNRVISKKDVEFCINEFYTLRLLRNRS